MQVFLKKNEKNLDSLEDKRDYLSMRFTHLQTINNRNERVK